MSITSKFDISHSTFTVGDLVSHMQSEDQNQKIIFVEEDTNFNVTSLDEIFQLKGESDGSQFLIVGNIQDGDWERSLKNIRDEFSHFTIGDVVNKLKQINENTPIIFFDFGNVTFFKELSHFCGWSNNGYTGYYMGDINSNGEDYLRMDEEVRDLVFP